MPSPDKTHALKANAEYGQTVALCGVTVRSSQITEPGAATCAKCRGKLDKRGVK